MDVKAEQKFLLLKKRLDSLHYCQPLTVESAALVEKLLNDLIKTTEGYQNMKKQNEENVSKLSKSENFLAPLKAENHKLIKESNDLHVAMMKLKEETEFKENKWKTQQRSMEGEKKDFKFVLEQKDLKLKKIVDENISIKSKLDYFMMKVYNPSSQHGFDNLPNEYSQENNWSQANISLPKKQDFQLSKPLKEVEEEMNKFSQQKNSDYKQWQDALRQSQERGENLQKSNEDLQDSKKLLEERQKQLETQIKNRDNEILRVQSKVDMGSVNLEKLSNDYQINQQVDKNERLYHQIDFLTTENNRLDKEIKDLNQQFSRTKDMRSENSKLNHQINDLCEKLEQAKKQLMQFESIKNNLKINMEKDFKNNSEQQNEKFSELQSLIDIKEMEINDCKSRLTDLFRENEQFKLQLEKQDQVIQNHKSDKRAFASNLQSIQQEQHEYTQKYSDMENCLQERTMQVNELQEEVNIQISKVQTLQRTIDLNERNNERIQSEYKLISEDQKLLKHTISSLEQQNLDDSQQKNELKMDLQRILNQKKGLEEQMDKFRSETYKIKSETEGKSVVSERLQILLDESQKDNEFLRKELRILEDLQRDQRHNLQDEEYKNKELFYKLQVLQESLNEVEKQYKITTDILQEKIKDLRLSENQRTEIERENMELRMIKKNFTDSQIKLQKQSENVNSSEMIRLKFNQELDTQKFKIIELEEKIQSLERQLETEILQRKKLADDYNEASLQNENLAQNITRIKEREREIENLRNDLDRTKEREKKLLMSLEKHVQELQKSEQLIANGARNTENLNYQKEEYQREIAELTSKLSYMGSDKQEGYSKSIHLQEKVNAQEISIHDLKDRLKKEEKKNQNLFEEVTLLSEEVSKLKSDKVEKEAYIKQLKTLTEGLERMREELLQRLQSKNNENYDTENEKSQLRREIKDLKSICGTMEEELKETRTSLVNIDRDRDDMQEQLDLKCEENQKLRLVLQNTEGETQQMKDKIFGFSSKCDSGSQRVNELEQNLKDSHKKIQNLLKENDNCKYTLQIKDKEQTELSNDLNVVTRENQSLSSKLVKISQNRDELREQNNAYMIEEKKQKQDIRGAELEKQDILNNYKHVCTVNERMERVLQEQAVENQQLFMRVKECEKEIAAMTAHLQHFENREQQMLQEIQAQERQIQFQNQRLEQQNHEFAQIQEEKSNTSKDFEYMRKVTEGVEQSREEMQRNLITLQNENQMMNDVLTDMKRKMDVLRSQNEYEKNQSEQLESIILKERASHHQDQQSSFTEKSELLQQIDRLSQKQKNQNNDQLQEKLISKSEEIQGMMIELRQLREENSKLRLTLYKYESEKQEMERRISSNNSVQSSISEQYDNKELEKFKQEREIYKKSLKETSQTSKVLSQKVKYLHQENDKVLFYQDEQ